MEAQQTPPPVLAPVTPFKQLLFRLREKNPAFFNWLSLNSFYFTLLTGGVPFLVNTAFPSMGLEIPDWLSYSNKLVVGISTLFAGAGLGSVFASNTALTTAPPPLITDDKPKAEDVSKQLAELQAQLAELKERQNQTGLYVLPGSAGSTFTQSTPTTYQSPESVRRESGIQ